MPRSMRKISETGIYHIMVRGNEKRNIFIDKWDKMKFINILKQIKYEEDYDLFAYCIMPNHVHIIIKESTSGISHIMRRINTIYAQYFNYKYDRVGHVFQDRFKSEVIENDTYLLCAIRYIHNNPVRANIVKVPMDYSWSSYKDYINGKSELIDRNFPLLLFNNNINKAITLFTKFTLKSNKDEFLDIQNYPENNNNILSKQDCVNLMNSYCEKYNVSLNILMNIKAYKLIRDEMIRKIKDNSKLSLRELEDILGMSKNTINRA
ncbi:transposase [Clostridium sp. D2Q-14]|uniref:REP-associated tyrosine transposase n=1 Tax=Anaeromonas gelatinilytica TaxID=2683194 RepID=UPI00193BDBAB|nr:transposase [Anaeromonas gelatinilytica]MBS4536477.1 transposase [Anaeromonas gelatinilytica]